MKLKDIGFYLACGSSLLITTSTAIPLGIRSVGIYAYGIFILLFFVTLITESSRVFNKQFKIEFSLICLFVIYSVFQFLHTGTEAIKSGFFFLVVPMLISIVTQLQTDGAKRKATIFILVFFFIQCLLAIYEKSSGFNLFPYKPTEENEYIILQDWQFRSTALLGHPLMNALCTSTILGFILTGGFSTKFKILCTALAIIAILCFNARAATLIIALYSGFFIVQNFITQKRKLSSKMGFVLFLLIGSSVLFYLFSETSLGGRIANDEKILDASAQSRLEVMRAFNYLEGFDLSIGNPNLYLPITNALGAAGVENSYIMIIIRYGLIFGVPLILLLLFYIKTQLKTFRLPEKFIIISAFLIVGSMNNSLANQAPWILFIICSKTFPAMSRQPVNLKHKRKRVAHSQLAYQMKP